MSQPKRRFAVKQSLIGGNFKYRPWKEWKEDEYVAGTLVAFQQDQFGHTNTHIKVVEADFLDKDLSESLVGQTLCLNSCGSINAAKDDMQIGSSYSFTYRGKITLEKGKFKGKEAHSVEVNEVDFDAPVVEAGGDDDLL